MTRTAVAAPPDPFGELFAYLDTLTVVQLYALIMAVHRRWLKR